MEHIRAECKPCNGCYTYWKCRCDDCKAEHRIVSKLGMRKARRPDSTIDDPLVSAKPARNHLIYLAEKGYGLVPLMEFSGINKVDLYRIRAGKRKRIRSSMESKVLGIGLHKLPTLSQCRVKRVQNWNTKQHRKSKKEGRDKRDNEKGFCNGHDGS